MHDMRKLQAFDLHHVNVAHGQTPLDGRTEVGRAMSKHEVRRGANSHIGQAARPWRLAQSHNRCRPSVRVRAHPLTRARKGDEVDVVLLG